MNLLEIPGFTPHCEQVLMYFGSYDVLNSERFGELVQQRSCFLLSRAAVPFGILCG